MFAGFDASLVIFAQRQPSLMDFLPMFAMIGLLFYFILWRPEKRRRSEMSQMLAELKKNDRVVTIGGIVGVVVNVPQNSDEITLRVDEGNNTRIHVLRSAISRVLTDEKASEKKDA